MTFQSSFTRLSMEQCNARALRGPTEAGTAKPVFVRALLQQSPGWNGRWQNQKQLQEYGPVTPPASNYLSSLTKQTVGRTVVEGIRKAALKDKHLNCLNQEPNLASFPEPPSKMWRPLFPPSIVWVQKDLLCLRPWSNFADSSLVLHYSYTACCWCALLLAAALHQLKSRQVS